MTMYANQCYNEVCYKGTTLYLSVLGTRSALFIELNYHTG